MSDGAKRPLAAMERIAGDLVARLQESCERIEIAGSIRRRRPVVGDIEIVAIPRFRRVEGPAQLGLFGPVKQPATRVNLLWESLDRLKPAYRLRGDRYRRFGWMDAEVDLFTCEAGNWGWIFLHRTGPARLRDRVGLLLARNGTPAVDGWIHDARRDPPRRLPTPEEEDVFGLVDLPFVAPERREEA